MTVLLFSIHPLNDNRISKHISTLLKNSINIEYVNASVEECHTYDHHKNVTIIQTQKKFTLRKPLEAAKILKFMKRQLKNSNAEIVHIHDSYLLPLVPLACKLGKKIVYDKHEVPELDSSHSARAVAAYERIKARHIDGIVYVTQSQKPFINKVGYRKSVFIPNYQQIAQYDAPDSEIKPMINLIYIGTLSLADRNTLLMLEVLELVLSKTKMVNVTIGGKVAQSAVEDRINSVAANFPDQFNYIGVVPYCDVIQKTKNADIGLLFFKDIPSTYYSSPNKLFEYILSGTVFIGVGKFLFEEEMLCENWGRTFNFKTSSEEIAHYILNLCQNPDKLNTMKKNAKQFGKNYTWESIENRYPELYNEILGGTMA